MKSFQKAVSPVQNGAGGVPRITGRLMESSVEELHAGKTKKEVIAAEIQRIDEFTSDLLKADRTSKALGIAHLPKLIHYCVCEILMSNTILRFKLKVRFRGSGGL